MTATGFTIAKVVVQGQGKPDAILEFGPGLNVVAGASDTGKSYASQLIDFMLGASTPPEPFPLGAGYDRAMIELLSAAGAVMTMQRALAGGGALVYRKRIDATNDGVPDEELAEKHSGLNPLTISARLLTMSGLMGKMIRQDGFGKKRTLSFRDIARLTLIDQVRIITRRSPALSEQFTLQTESKSAFGLLLTGSDDSAIVTQEKPKDRTQRLKLEMSILSGLLEEREVRLTEYAVDLGQLADQRRQLAIAVEEASGLVATRQGELDSAASIRDQAWEAIQTLKSKQLFVTEQLSRLELLARHYTADKDRLNAALEAGKFFEQMPTGDCPVCGHIVADAEEPGASDLRLREFQAACAAELGKISVLVRDLDGALTDMRSEKLSYEREQAQLQATLERANVAMAGLLDRKVRAANEQLSQLLALDKRLSEAAFTAKEVDDLRNRRSIAEQQSKIKPKKSEFAQKVGAAGTAEFCLVVEQLLKDWKFPFEGRVSWAETEFDLVIGNQGRGSMGQGKRAVTHAAFTVALMRYCRQKGLPHPGIVVIDSPLNPFKGADIDSGERINTDVQEAFYADLAADKSGDQIIVFENTEPPVALRSKMRYTHFSGNADKPRAGFFPMPQSVDGDKAKSK